MKGIKQKNSSQVSSREERNTKNIKSAINGKIDGAMFGKIMNHRGFDGTYLSYHILGCGEYRIPATGRCYSSLEE